MAILLYSLSLISLILNLGDIHCQYFYRNTLTQTLVHPNTADLPSHVSLEYPVTATPYYFASDLKGRAFMLKLTESAGTYTSTQVGAGIFCTGTAANGKKEH